jgi:hypothetical protein
LAQIWHSVFYADHLRSLKNNQVLPLNQKIN